MILCLDENGKIQKYSKSLIRKYMNMQTLLNIDETFEDLWNELQHEQAEQKQDKTRKRAHF